MAQKRNPKMLDQLQYCEKNQVELCVIIGSSELEAGTVKIRIVDTREEVREFLLFLFEITQNIYYYFLV